MVELTVVGHGKINAEPAEKKPAASSGDIVGRQIPETFAAFFARQTPGNAPANVVTLADETPAKPTQNKGVSLSGQDDEETLQAGAIAADGPLAPDIPAALTSIHTEIAGSIGAQNASPPAETADSALQILASAQQSVANNRDTPRALSPGPIAPIDVSTGARSAAERIARAPFADPVGASQSTTHLIHGVDPAAITARIDHERGSPEPVSPSVARTAEATTPYATTVAPPDLGAAVEAVIVAADPLSPVIRGAELGLRLAPPPTNTISLSPSAAAFEIASVAPRDGGGIELRLDPPDLGAVTIQFFEDEAGVLRASVAADKSETLDLLRRNADALHRELARHGAGEFLLSFSQRRDDGGRGSAAGSAQIFQFAQTPAALSESASPTVRLQRTNGIDLIA